MIGWQHGNAKMTLIFDFFFSLFFVELPETPATSQKTPGNKA